MTGGLELITSRPPVNIYWSSAWSFCTRAFDYGPSPILVSGCILTCTAEAMKTCVFTKLEEGPKRKASSVL